MGIRTGDQVVVISGKSKGKKGTVKSVEENRVIIGGVNMVVKHRKARNTKQKSAREKREAAIDVSNVMILCKCGKATRIAHKIDANGVKHRVCAKCGEILDKKYVRVKEKSKDAEEVKETDKEKADKKPLQRRESRFAAESRVKGSQVTGGATNTHRQLGGGA